MLENLFSIHNQVVNEDVKKHKRYLYDKIEWKERAICLMGARGVGKTTLLLQHYWEVYKSVERCLYLSADNIQVAGMGLFNIAQEYFSYGGETLIIDEAHKYPDWSSEVKNIIDTYKNRKIILSGSSSLALQKGGNDLSRRLLNYELKGLSFREFLLLEAGGAEKVLDFDDILENHVKHAERISKHSPILRHFKEYLLYGYYPYFLEGKGTYLAKLANVIEKVIVEDIAGIYKVTSTNLPVLKKMLWLISSSEPFIPNIDKMSRELGVSKEYTYLYLEYLEKAHLLMSIREKLEGFKLVRKPAKIFLNNTNLAHAILGKLNLAANEGAARETFFINQVSGQAPLFSAAKGDFLVKGKYVMEIGGKNKNREQIKNIKNSFIAADGIEIGAARKIPLYLFGFLY